MVTNSIRKLRDTEQGVLNYMLLSEDNFCEIKDKLLEDDFTFVLHKVIFKYFILLKEHFFFNNTHGITNMGTLIEIYAEILKNEENIKATSVLEILSEMPSMYIKRDLEILNANSMEKEIAVYSNEIQRKGTIETKYGLTWFHFINDILISVGTTNISQLPTELHSSFTDTFNSLFQVDLQNGENEVSMTFYKDSGNLDDIESFYLKKDVPQLQWFDDICVWADKYNLDENTFPRDRYKLQDLSELDISDKNITEIPKEISGLINLRMLIVDNNQIQEFPDELYQLKHLGVLSFLKNEVSYISEDIVNLQELLLFAACHNNIENLPKNFFKLTHLKHICLHGNNLTSISNDIGNLVNLESMTISNNDIEELPQSIVKLENLESLDIENTQIKEIPIEFLKHRALNRLSISDSLFPSIVENMQYLNVDTINLSVSEFQESSSIIKKLNLKVSIENWMEDRDKLNNGCIELSKYKNEEDKE